VIFFNSLEDLKTEKDYAYLDYIYLGKINNYPISAQTERTLSQWIRNGNTLIIETGAVYKKVMNGLPEGLINVRLDGVEDIYLEKVIGLE